MSIIPSLKYKQLVALWQNESYRTVMKTVHGCSIEIVYQYSVFVICIEYMGRYIGNARQNAYSIATGAFNNLRSTALFKDHTLGFAYKFLICTALLFDVGV